MSTTEGRRDVSTSPKPGMPLVMNDTPPKSPPPPPVPASDPGLAAQIADPTAEATAPTPLGSLADDDDIFAIQPLTALKLLSAGIEVLVQATGDIPPTPPPTTPHVPSWRGMQAEKESIVRSHSERSLARMREMAEQAEPAKQEGQNKENTVGQSTQQEGFPFAAPVATGGSVDESGSSSSSGLGLTTISVIQQVPQAPLPGIDGVQLRAAPTPAPAPLTSTPEPYVVIGSDSQPLNLQHSAITRKFYSKKPPPIGISDYLLRMHRFCPMSTAVYLATSLYIHRLAVDERAIAVTRRNAHRLLLAGLRVAMKALEDLSYPHAKVARVGGVSETELARLEISFCFLAGFELVVGEEKLRRHWHTLREGKGLGMIGNIGVGDALGNAASAPVLRLHRQPKGPGEHEVGGREATG